MSDHRFFRISFFLFVLAFSSTARADADGKATATPVKCTASVFSAADTICKLFSEFAGADACTVTDNICVSGSQELFTGANIELASPTNIKNWTGFGGGGAGYQAANLCLLRDLKDGPLTSEAAASTALGDIRTQQTVQFESFDRDKLEWVGWQRAKACAPVVGCLDIITQRIRAKAVATPYGPGSGKFAGEYAILSSHSMEIEADGLAQSLKTTIPAIQVSTPYGVVSAKPEFGMGRAIGFVGAPWNSGNIKSLLSGPWGNAKMVDLYGRNPGTMMTQTYPMYAVFGNGLIDNRVIGYISQLGFGSRDVNPKTTFWNPPAGVEFPVRPDTDLEQARSSIEKTPNAYLGANVKVQYSPVDLIPEEIRNNGFITIALDVWAKPLVDTGFSTQLDIQHFEIADGRKMLTPTGPIDYRPGSMDEWKGVNIAGASSVAARVALEAGVDLTVHLNVPLPWPLDDIDVDLINIHPVATPLESTVSAYNPSSKTAYAFTQSKASAMTGEWFQQYHKFSGAVPSGKAEVLSCLSAPNVSQAPPPAPTYTPGNPKDLTKLLQYPCNICVGMNEYKYKDEKGVEHVVPGFIKTFFPADESSMPASDRWSCNLVAEAGCYDMCTYDPNTKALTVTETAIQMLASGKTKNMPRRCR
jgi:hypothetical protein